MEVLPAISLNGSSVAGTQLVDVGRNFAGFASVTVNDVPAGSTVRVWPSETMTDGAIEQASGGTPMYWQAFTDARVAPSLVNVTLRPVFSTYGWRWLAVQVLPPSGPAGAIVSARPVNGTIVVGTATYGGNCNASLHGDMSAELAAWCNGQDACQFEVCVCGSACSSGAPPCVPDPSYGACCECRTRAGGVWSASRRPRARRVREGFHCRLRLRYGLARSNPQCIPTCGGKFADGGALVRSAATAAATSDRRVWSLHSGECADRGELELIKHVGEPHSRNHCRSHEGESAVGAH